MENIVESFCITALIVKDGVCKDINGLNSLSLAKKSIINYLSLSILGYGGWKTDITFNPCNTGVNLNIFLNSLRYGPQPMKCVKIFFYKKWKSEVSGFQL